jgi:hypothetical protein
MRTEKSFLWKHEGKGSLGRLECGLEDYTETLLREVNGGEWILDLFSRGIGNND